MPAVFLSPAHAEDQFQIWDAPITRVWLDEHVAMRHAAPASPAYRLTRTQIWASGIAPASHYPFASSDLDRVIGAKLQPFHDLNFNVGTQMTRSGGDARSLSGAASWEAFWSRDVRQGGGLIFGLSATGSMDYADIGYSQSLVGTLGIPLDLPTDRWWTEFRLSPRMNLDLTGRSVETGLLSEVMGRAVIGSRSDPFLSVLNVKLGYSLAPDARPVASARLELKISPNL